MALTDHSSFALHIVYDVSLLHSCSTTICKAGTAAMAVTVHIVTVTVAV